MKIAFFLTGGRFGGIERLFIVLAKSLSKHVKRIDFVLTDIDGEVYPQIPKDAGYNIINLKAKRLRQVLPALTKYLHKEKPDMLISGSLTTNIYAVIAKIISFSRTKIVVGVHSILSQLKKSGSLLFGALPLLSRLTYRFAYRIIADSYNAADDFAATTGIPRKNISVIYNPVPINEILKESQIFTDHKFFAKDHPPVIISVGRIEKEKNYSLLLKAFSMVREHRDARLLIISEGSQKENLWEEAKRLNIYKDVDFPGFVPSPYPYMKNSSVFALSSDHEAFGIVIIEALALGIPVVATDCPGGVREVLDNGKYGKLVAVGDAKAFADAIEYSILNPPDPDFLKKRALDFSAEKITGQYLKVLGIKK